MQRIDGPSADGQQDDRAPAPRMRLGRRTAAVIAGSVLIAGSGLVAGVALGGTASAEDASTTTSSSTTDSTRPTPGEHITTFMSKVLADLVSKGTLTKAQGDAVTQGIKDRIAAQDALRAEFRTKAEALVAKAHGLSVTQFREKRASRTLEPLTQEQRTTLREQLQALATELGLDEIGPHGMGFGPEGMPGMDGDGMGRGMGGHGHHGPGDWDGDGMFGPDSDSGTGS